MEAAAEMALVEAVWAEAALVEVLAEAVLEVGALAVPALVEVVGLAEAVLVLESDGVEALVLDSDEQDCIV